MAIRRSDRSVHQIFLTAERSGHLSLGELRDFVTRCSDIPDAARVFYTNSLAAPQIVSNLMIEHVGALLED